MAGEWIAGRLGASIGTVAWCVPRGYAAYVRVFHPAYPRPYERSSWAEVAPAMGRRAHPLMQWHALVGAWPDGRTGSRFAGLPPHRGELEPDLLGVLCSRLAEHTSHAQDCHIAVWEGWGGLEPGRFDPELIELPLRSYLHLAAPLERALELGRSPNLLWPGDRSWFVASEIDFDSTLVGGSEALATAILAASKLETARVREDDSLRFDGDRVNDG